jgi:antitoxin component of MazEF toxin-antitoxin module
MVKKLVAHGNSAALIIDKPILELLDINMDTLLEIKTDGVSLIISPAEKTEKARKVLSALEKVNRKHQATLKKLAE